MLSLFLLVCLGRYTGYHHDHEHEFFSFLFCRSVFFWLSSSASLFGSAIFPVERFFALQKVGGTEGSALWGAQYSTSSCRRACARAATEGSFSVDTSRGPGVDGLSVAACV